MTARHRVYSTSSRWGPAAKLIGVVAGAAIAATVTVVVVNGQAARACTGHLNLPVTVAPALQPVAQDVANSFNNSAPSAQGQCVQVQVTAEGSAEVADALPGAQIGPPALWIPDSSLWAKRVKQLVGTQDRFAPTIDIHPSLATSPLVLATPASLAAKQTQAETQPSWQGVISGSLPAVIGNPTTTTEGLASLVMVGALLGDPTDAPSPQLVAVLLKLGRTAVSDIGQEFVADRGDTAFTATEQAVAQHNRDIGRQDYAAVFPDDGTLIFDYPVVRVASRTEAPGTADAAAEFEQALRTADTTDRLGAAGFRNAQGQLPVGLRAFGSQEAQLTTVPNPANTVTSNLLRTWSAINLDSRFLTVLDVSGSMADVTPNGKTKAEVVRDAASLGLNEFPDTTEVGLWAFSDQLAPPNDWRELVPIGPLGEPMAGGTRRTALQAGTAQLPALVHGGTALYSTALAAYQAIRQNYDPTKINAVVLMTDGMNDTNHGPDLPTLLAQLKSMQDPARPLPLFTIGIGPTADMDALRQISAATGGKAYQAINPDDITGVFLDVMVQRTCRPHC